MKMLLVANAKDAAKEARFTNEVRAQLANSIRLGWKPADIIIVTNIKELTLLSEYGIRYEENLNKRCLTGSKMFALAKLLDEFKETVWAHDLDVWQTFPFSEPLFRDVGISTYSRVTKYNGGSVFWKPAAVDMVHVITTLLEQGKSEKEEPTINKILKLDTYKDRATVLNTTYNVGCSGFKVRFEEAEKPVKCVHFHPCNRIAWDTHVRDRNKLGASPVPDALMGLLVNYFPCIKTHVYEATRGHGGDWQRPEGVKHE